VRRLSVAWGRSAALERLFDGSGLAHLPCLQGERRAGFVGLPLPGVRVQVAQDADAPSGVDPDPSSGATATPYIAWTEARASCAAARAGCPAPSAALPSPLQEQGPAAVPQPSTCRPRPTHQQSSPHALPYPAPPCMHPGEPLTGDLRVGGPFLFKEYWGRPEATADAFDANGFFKTGDVVGLEGRPPYFRVRGTAAPADSQPSHQLTARCAVRAAAARCHLRGARLDAGLFRVAASPALRRIKPVWCLRSSLTVPCAGAWPASGRFWAAQVWISSSPTPSRCLRWRWRAPFWRATQCRWGGVGVCLQALCVQWSTPAPCFLPNIHNPKGIRLLRDRGALSPCFGGLGMLLISKVASRLPLVLPMPYEGVRGGGCPG
jgi:hypothetical protein